VEGKVEVSKIRDARLQGEVGMWWGEERTTGKKGTDNYEGERLQAKKSLGHDKRRFSSEVLLKEAGESVRNPEKKKI